MAAAEATGRGHSGSAQHHPKRGDTRLVLVHCQEKSQSANIFDKVQACAGTTLWHIQTSLPAGRVCARPGGSKPTIVTLHDPKIGLQIARPQHNKDVGMRRNIFRLHEHNTNIAAQFWACARNSHPTAKPSRQPTRLCTQCSTTEQHQTAKLQGVFPARHQIHHSGRLKQSKPNYTTVINTKLPPQRLTATVAAQQGNHSTPS